MLIAVIAINKYSSQKQGIAQQIDDLRKKTQPRFDSLSRLMNDENNFHNNILKIIETKDLNLANKLVDSAIKSNPSRHILFTYKGMIYAAQDRHSEAIEQFNKSMSMASEFPLALNQKAQSFIKLNNFNSAIIDLKKAAELNYDFNYQVARAYEQMDLIDSAIVYYTKYLDHYPEKTKVREHLSSLTSNLK